MISREEAIKHLHHISGFIFDVEWKESIDMAIESLSNERPKGRWIKDRHGPYCSNCKRYTPLIIPEDFCGHCGSDNRGEEE